MDPQAIPFSSQPRHARSARVAFVLAWCLFWALMLSLEWSADAKDTDDAPWRPLLWTGSAMVVASAIVWCQWQDGKRHDKWLLQPWRWFARQLAWVALSAPVFVAMVYALRHAAFALVGQAYLHDAWPRVFGYEMPKYAMFGSLFVAVVYGLRSSAAHADVRLALERERRLAQQAQLLQLAQQIQPHFLFNALNAIAAFIHTDPRLADELITRLAALLRAASDLSRRPEASLDEELDLLQAYALIMQQRFGKRVTVSFEVDPQARPCMVPSLCLQPLLENAFKHGAQQQPGDCRITVRAKVQGKRLQLEVHNSSGALSGPLRPGVGMSNLQERLKARHGAQASLTLQSTLPAGVVARIEMPCVS